MYTINNIVRTFPPLMGLLVFYYAVWDRSSQLFYANETLNGEYETAYLKMQSFRGHYAEKLSLMT